MNTAGDAPLWLTRGEGALRCPECVVFAVDAGRVVRGPAAARHEVEPAYDGQGRWTLW